MTHNRSHECQVMCRYLVGERATIEAEQAYLNATEHIAVLFSHKQQHLWNACLKNNWILPHVDAWLGFSDRRHPIRKMMFIMIGILETQPHYCHYFLPAKRSILYPILLSVQLTGGLFKIIIGRLITWII